jgi:hypothetical protein
VSKPRLGEILAIGENPEHYNAALCNVLLYGGSRAGGAIDHLLGCFGSRPAKLPVGHDMGKRPAVRGPATVWPSTSDAKRSIELLRRSGRASGRSLELCMEPLVLSDGW